MTQAQKLPRGQVVTATNFVRNFATYARNTRTEPVHIVNHGRPAWSLVATEDLARLADGLNETGEKRIRAKLDIVLDTIPTLVVLTDEDLNVLRVNSAARIFFQLSDEEIRGAPLGRIFKDPRQEFIVQATRRVRDSGATETFEIDSVDAPLRTFSVKIVSFPGGTALFADEITLALAVRRADDLSVAFGNIIDALPGLARGMMDMRGVIVAVSPAVMTMVGADEARILGVRFAGLFDVSSRAEMSDAIEKLLSKGKPFTKEANLLTQHARLIEVIVSAAPHRDYDKGLGALFMLKQTMG